MKLSTRDMTFVGLFVALFVISALISRFFPTIVPFSLQPFVAVLAGVTLGKRLGALAAIVYLLIGLVGVPVFAKAPFGGPGYFMQPTFGFLIGFALAAYLAGWIAEQKLTVARYIAGAMVAVLMTYVTGMPWLYVILKNVMAVEGVNWAYVFQIGMAPFVLLDLVKGAVAGALGYAVVRRLPQLAVRQSKAA